MNPEEFTQHLEHIKLELEQWTATVAPRIAGKVAANHFTENFQKEGFVNGGLQKWAPVRRKENPPATPRGQTLAGRPILTGDTGDLGRSLSYDTARNSATVYSDVPYAAAHNQGTRNAGRNHSVVIPRRRFMGASQELDKKIEKEIIKKLKSIKP